MLDTKKQDTRKSPATIIEIVVIAILLIFITIMITTCFAFRSKGNTPKIFGTYLYQTRAVNMIPEIPENTLIFASDKDIDKIVPGKVIICKIDESTILTRVRELISDNGNQYYVVKFDTSPENQSFKISKTDIIAVAEKQDSALGKVVSFATTTYGILLIIILPCFLIILFQILKIVSLKRLEEQAASLDDIDEMIFTREKEEPSPVTFTKPVFKEDATEELPVLNTESVSKADYTAQSAKSNDPLFTSDKYDKEFQPQTANTLSDFSDNNFFMNKPAKPESRSKVDEFFETYKEQPVSANYNSSATKNTENVEKVKPVYTPFINNVISDDTADVRENVSEQVHNTSFDDSVKAFYNKDNSKEPVYEEVTKIHTDTTNQKAVVSSENIATAKKKKSNKALDELMSMIDKEENKLKK